MEYNIPSDRLACPCDEQQHWEQEMAANEKEEEERP